jgi:hypothetical protein
MDQARIFLSKPEVEGKVRLRLLEDADIDL